MIFTYAIDPALAAAVVSMPSSVHARDIAETISAVYLDPHWRPGFSTLWDGLAITELHMEWSDLSALVHVQRDHEHLAGAGVDVIVVTRAVDRSLASAYALLAKAGPRRTRVVGSMAEAMSVLGR